MSRSIFTTTLTTAFCATAMTFCVLPAVVGQTLPALPIEPLLVEIIEGKCADEVLPCDDPAVTDMNPSDPILPIPDVEPPGIVTLRPPAPSSTSPGRRRREKQQTFEEIRSALSRLKKDLKPSLRPTPPAPLTPKGSRLAGKSIPEEIGLPHSDLSPPLPPRIPVVPEPVPVIVQETQPQAGPGTADDVLADGSGLTDGSGSDDLFGLGGVPLVDGPVDRIALADNFYAEQEYSIALRMYNEVRTKGLPVEQLYWIRFQQASCLRRMGDIDAARKTYRILAGRKDGGWLASMSTWWLNRMEERAELTQQISQVEARLAELKESDDESENL